MDCTPLTIFLLFADRRYIFFPLLSAIGANCRVKGVRAVRDLGWKPRPVSLDMFGEVTEAAIMTY